MRSITMGNRLRGVHHLGVLIDNKTVITFQYGVTFTEDHN